MEVKLAFLVIALDANETTTASQILATNGEQLGEVIANDTTGWVTTMPDISVRIATLKSASTR